MSGSWEEVVLDGYDQCIVSVCRAFLEHEYIFQKLSITRKLKIRMGPH